MRLFAESQVVICFNSLFNISIVLSTVSPSIKILVSSANKIGKIVLETPDKYVSMYNINKSGQRTGP